MGCNNMGCNCGGRRRNVVSRTQNSPRPVVGPIQNAQDQGTLAAARNPTQLRALSAQPVRSAAGLSKERRALEKKRREILANKFGK